MILSLKDIFVVSWTAQEISQRLPGCRCECSELKSEFLPIFGRCYDSNPEAGKGGGVPVRVWLGRAEVDELIAVHESRDVPLVVDAQDLPLASDPVAVFGGDRAGWGQVVEAEITTPRLNTLELNQGPSYGPNYRGDYSRIVN